MKLLPMNRQAESISSGAQYVTLQKYFSHPSFVMFFFGTPPIKLKLERQIRGGLLIANHMDQSVRWANQRHWTAVRSYLLHSFLQVHSLLCLLPAMATCAIKLSQNYFPEPNRHKSNCTVRNHRPRTAGEALIITFHLCDRWSHGWGTFPNCSHGLGCHYFWPGLIALPKNTLPSN